MSINLSEPPVQAPPPPPPLPISSRSFTAPHQCSNSHTTSPPTLRSGKVHFNVKGILCVAPLQISLLYLFILILIDESPNKILHALFLATHLRSFRNVAIINKKFQSS